jgi:hypothetical protein
MLMNEPERKAVILDLKKQFRELHKEAYEKNANLGQERGLQFEKLVRAVFKAWGMLVRGAYHTGDNRSEQIDGVLQFENRYALLEVKWEKANLAASELFSFLGKVEGKFAGTIGVFVSRNELTTNFLTALRAGRRQSIIVIHGRDVDDLFDPGFDLPGYLAAHVLNVCMDNLCHLSTEKYLVKLKTDDVKKKAASAVADTVTAKIEECLKDEAAKNIVNEFAEELTAAQRADAVLRIVKNYADVASSPNDDEDWRSDNLQEFLKELVARLPGKLTPADSAFFMDKLSKDFQNSHYRPMTEYFAPRYVYLPAHDKRKYEDRLVRQWDTVIGDWMSENRMAEATRPVWNHLDRDTRKHLIGHFVEFVLSNRGDRHPQYQLADYVLKKKDNVATAKKFLRDHAEEAAKTWMEEDYTDELSPREIMRSVKSAMRSMRRYVPDFEDQIKAAVESAAEHSKVRK